MKGRVNIKVPSGYYVEPLKREQTQRELIDKMAQDLSNLPRFYAWTKTLQKISKDGERVAIVETHKVKTFPLEAHDNEEKKTSPLPLEKFCKLRSEIEEEIAHRQAIWKKGLSSPPAEKKEKKKAGTSKSPPPTSLSTQESGKEDAANDTNEEGLIYRTNFYLPDERWDEGETVNSKCFRQDGYFHIMVKKESELARINCINIPVTDFRVHVDTELVKDERGVSVHGLLFRYIEDGDKVFFYLFALQFKPRDYALFFYDDNKWISLVDYRSCEFIRNNGANSLMVEMVGKQIKLGINGRVLDTIEDNNLTSGFTGVFVSKDDDSVAELRCRNFRLYSLAGKTSKAPPTITTS